jgi:hypothetical protein
MRKRPVLLLELCIAMVLMGGIVAVLFSSYTDLSLSKFHLKEEKEKVFNRQRLHLRLEQIFSRLGSWKVLEKEGCFFSYDNGADLDPAFRGVVEGMIYIDKGELILTTWPEKGDPRQEILCENANNFSIEFFDSSKGEWIAGYPAEKPFMIKMKLNKEEIPFFL